MSDEDSDSGESTNEAAQTFDNFGDYARFKAASHANFAETLDQSRRQISEVVNRLARPSSADNVVIMGPPLGDLLSGFEEGAQRMKLLSSLNAAQAVAWDHMQAHGGPDDPDAYAEYGAATEFHTALMSDAPEAEKTEDEEFPTRE